MTTKNLVLKIWSFCDTLRDDGLGYNDYLEQLTYLLFLKMADENTNKYELPSNCNWQNLLKIKGGELLDQYEKVLKTLAEAGGMLEKIFTGAQNKINDSAKLKKLINLIDEENWTSTGIDIKGEIYESLLQKNAENSGAGQYFTPRAVISAMVECINPEPGETISDPACGTGGFFLGALEHILRNKLNDKQNKFLKFETFHGWEIETSTARLCLMNLFLHGVGDLKETPEIEVRDSLKVLPAKKTKIVLANPPFGKSSSDIPTPDVKLSDKEGYYLREDFWVTTSNKQLAFLQHIVAMLDETGRAAVVLPDNVLFEGGAGELVRSTLLKEVNLHTILRLPTGIFYAQGVNSNVLFFDKVRDLSKPATNEIWYYDYRTNIRHTPKKNPLNAANLKDFIKSYNFGKLMERRETWSTSNPTGRWRKYHYNDIIKRDKINLDISWLKDENLLDYDNLPDPDDLIGDIIVNMENALMNLKTMKESLL
ncbi:N-6 DNA methylase [Pedobacter sp. HMF7647]|uniref:site-specific DNA-methyltransferase (adenine-specific) n=1 Tax=Hufsiella arboris TaxID=2695275 RepID=A0A7K1YBJ9_9SPHI|nr:class I SAM-dependent DNA methyltransferase [Hufsiella arboris]MXV51972.1 N-6 DNA methylase [Hufsiella arboris]